MNTIQVPKRNWPEIVGRLHMSYNVEVNAIIAQFNRLLQAFYAVKLGELNIDLVEFSDDAVTIRSLEPDSTEEAVIPTGITKKGK